MSRLVPLVLLVAVALVAGLARAGSADAIPGVVNPHGSPAGCLSCHDAGAGGAVGAARPVVATCRSCHPTADMHPVGMPPGAVHVPASFPLEAGLVTCATCHAEPAHGGEAATLASPWHRGGPYAEPTRFCYACHESRSYTRADPHHPATPRDPADPSCAACHTGNPAPGAAAADARLRFPTDAACGTCHEGAVHGGLEGHLGRVVDPARAVALGATLPLGAGGVITCWTCHEVHGGPPDPGLGRARPVAEAFRSRSLAAEWAALADPAVRWPGETDPAHPPLLALPASDGTLCRACHGEGP